MQQRGVPKEDPIGVGRNSSVGVQIECEEFSDHHDRGFQHPTTAQNTIRNIKHGKVT